MTQILEFVEHTTSDLRGGRHSWRVRTILWTLSLTAAVAAHLIVH